MIKTANWKKVAKEYAYSDKAMHMFKMGQQQNSNTAHHSDQDYTNRSEQPGADNPYLLFPLLSFYSY